MKELATNKIGVLLAVFLFLEILSFGGFQWPLLSAVVFVILAVATLALTIYSLEFGVLVVFAELFIGSLGHLFYLNLGSVQLPIRISLWVIVMLVFGAKLLSQFIKQKWQAPYWLDLKNFPGRKYFGLLLLFVLIGLINGLIRGHSLMTIFLDFNAWLYFFFLWPVIAVYGNAEPAKVQRLKNVFMAAVIWLSLKTLFLLFVFTHNIGFAPDIYLWLRKTLVGEMTPTKTGWPRIFIQGQIYSALAFFLVFWYRQSGVMLAKFWSRKNVGGLLLAAWFLSAVLLSFSRSFWVALIGALGLSLIFIWHRTSFRKMLVAAGWFISAGLLSIVLIYLVVAFPYIHLPAEDFSSNFLDRVSTGNEAALASRWSLLPVLLNKIEQEPFLGQGYGATVTYFSRDPRILENNPTGEYTTYIFEWGYLDLWLKLGLLGLAAYLWLLFKLIRAGLRRGRGANDPLFFALAAGLLFLVITHAFTPYLNHPLGIGFLLVSSCLIWPNRVY